jgi:hypothetical protein
MSSDVMWGDEYVLMQDVSEPAATVLFIWEERSSYLNEITYPSCSLSCSARYMQENVELKVKEN